MHASQWGLAGTHHSPMDFQPLQFPENEAKDGSQNAGFFTV
jgi:hypothetical protein